MTAHGGSSPRSPPPPPQILCSRPPLWPAQYFACRKQLAAAHAAVETAVARKQFHACHSPNDAKKAAALDEAVTKAIAATRALEETIRQSVSKQVRASLTDCRAQANTRALVKPRICVPACVCPRVAQPDVEVSAVFVSFNNAYTRDRVLKALRSAHKWRNTWPLSLCCGESPNFEFTCPRTGKAVSEWLRCELRSHQISPDLLVQWLLRLLVQWLPTPVVRCLLTNMHVQIRVAQVRAGAGARRLHVGQSVHPK